MKPKIHAAAGGLAFLTIAVFWLSTVLSETMGSHEEIALVKTAILFGMAVLIPSLMIAGGTGFSLGSKWKSPIIAAKARRMRLIALNGVLILLPSAITLAMMAQSGTFDLTFYAVQALELIAGAANFAMIGMNMKAGFAMRSRKQAAV